MGWLRRLPVVLAMGLLLLPGAAWLGGVTGPALEGMETPPPKPQLHLQDVASGAYQTAFAAYFDRALPLLPDAVLVKNQLYYTLLRQSGVEPVVIGRHRQLYEPAYIAEYCSRDIAGLHDAAERWAGELARVQAWYAARDKVFLYLMTPDKAPTYPQYFPANIPCRAPVADRDGYGAAWDRILDAHGVRYVDGAAITRAARGRYPFEMFPLGGTHWNDVAAALTTQAVVEAVNAAPTPWKLQEFSFSWHMVPPHFIALDLTELLNVPFPRLDFPIPDIDVVGAAPAACQAPNLGIVGGSFTYGVMWTLMQAPCPPAIEFYTYFKIERTIFPGDIRGPFDPAQRDDELLHRADVVILEENESLMMRSNHGPAFAQLVPR